MLPPESDAIDQMYVEGVVAIALKAGASSRPPSLRRAMPLAVPLISSSNLDCSHVRVPSARANTERAMVETMSADSSANVLRAKVIPHFKGMEGRASPPGGRARRPSFRLSDSYLMLI